jgi:hypothetical protein
VDVHGLSFRTQRDRFDFNQDVLWQPATSRARAWSLKNSAIPHDGEVVHVFRNTVVFRTLAKEAPSGTVDRTASDRRCCSMPSGKAGNRVDRYWPDELFAARCLRVGPGRCCLAVLT